MMLESVIIVNMEHIHVLSSGIPITASDCLCSRQLNNNV